MTDIDSSTLEEVLFNNSQPQDNLFLNLLDLDYLFNTSPNALLLNRIDYNAKDYVEQRNKLVFARTSELNFVAHCDCENLADNRYIGVKCNICGTYCRDDFSETGQIEHNTWLGMPESIPGVLHPTAYIVLSNWLSRKGGPNYIDAIIDPTLDLPPELEGIVQGRGHQYFFHNFDYLIAQFLHYFRTVAKNPTKKRNADAIETFVRNYRSVMFCTKLPVMSQVLHSITSADGSAEGRQYADAGSQIILDAATDLQNLESSTSRMRPNSIPTVVHRVYTSYIKYIIEIEHVRLSKKKSLIRRHMLGTRLHFSVRSVIIPHQDRYDELYFPWSVAVNLLKLHIKGRLMWKYKMSVGDASTRLVTALMCYDPLIDQIMKDLIAECSMVINGEEGFPGLPLLFNRNPSLRRGAIQLLYVTRIKPDVDDDTINISTLILKDPNAIQLAA